MYTTSFKEAEAVTEMWGNVMDVITENDSAWVDDPDSDSPKITVVCNTNGLSAEKLIKEHDFILCNRQGTDPKTVRLMNFL